MDLDSLLNDATEEGGKKKKSDVPTITLEGEEVDKAKEWLDAVRIIDLNEAKKKAIEEDLAIVAREKHLEFCQKNAKVTAAIKLIVTDDDEQADTILVTCAKDQYKKIPKSNQPELAKIFGKETEKFFRTQMEISLTPAALEDREILVKLVKSVGEENFKKYFKVEQTLKPTKPYHEGRFLNDKVKAKADQAAEEGLVVPYAPSFKAN